MILWSPIYIYFRRSIVNDVLIWRTTSPLYKRVIHILCAFSFHSFSIHSSFYARGLSTFSAMCRALYRCCRGRGFVVALSIIDCCCLAALHICIYSWLKLLSLSISICIQFLCFWICLLFSFFFYYTDRLNIFKGNFNQQKKKKKTLN